MNQRIRQDTDQFGEGPGWSPGGIAVLGRSIGCGDAGAGLPFVMLHCSGADRSHWDRVMRAWSGSGGPRRRFICPELFGYGLTSRWAGRASITLQDYVALVDTALPALRAPFDLVGHSFGGAVALAFARAFPRRVRTLTLIEPAAFFVLRDAGRLEAELFGEILQIGLTMQRAAWTAPNSCEQAMQIFVDYWNGGGKWQTLPAAARAALAGQTDIVALEFAAIFAEAARLSDCRTITVPTIVVSGEYSPKPARHIARLLADTIPQARHVCIAEAGHMIPLSHAEALAMVLRDAHSPAVPI